MGNFKYDLLLKSNDPQADLAFRTVKMIDNLLLIYLAPFKAHFPFSFKHNCKNGIAAFHLRSQEDLAFSSKHLRIFVTEFLNHFVVSELYEINRQGYCGYANLKNRSRKSALWEECSDEVTTMTKKLNEIIRRVKKKNNFGGHRFRSTEWMYDIHWYRDCQGKDYMPEDLHLAAECELYAHRYKKDKNESHREDAYAAVKYDFQKLLITNAELRLMVFRFSSSASKLSEHPISIYFMEAISRYRQLAAGSRFLIACFIGDELFFKRLPLNFSKIGLTINLYF